MRRPIRLSIAASSVALAAGGMITLASALPASAATTTHTAPTATITAVSPDLTPSSCTSNVVTNLYLSQFGYYTVNARRPSRYRESISRNRGASRAPPALLTPHPPAAAPPQHHRRARPDGRGIPRTSPFAAAR